jgi:hypothetical protein
LAVGATAAAAAPSANRFADDALNARLQQVVQHSNDEQIQAIATNNVSLVSDSVTGQYAQQLTSTLQEMITVDKVTGISVIAMQWGPVTVAADGSSATVTTVETWRIVSAAGSVDDAPTRNDYTLVPDNGVWKITSDVQTVGAATLVPTDTPTVTPTATSTPTDTPTAVPSATATPAPTAAPGDLTNPAAPATDVTVPDTEMPAPETGSQAAG